MFFTYFILWFKTENDLKYNITSEWGHANWVAYVYHGYRILFLE